MQQPWVPLVDVSDMTMTEIMNSAELNPILNRLLASLDDPDGIISAFQSYVE